MQLNINKCKALSIGREGTLSKYKYGFNTAKGFEELEQVASIKDLGIIVDTGLTFTEHIQVKINKAYSILGIIRRTFSNIDRSTFFNAVPKSGQKPAGIWRFCLVTIQKKINRGYRTSAEKSY